MSFYSIIDVELHQHFREHHLHSGSEAMSQPIGAIRSPYDITRRQSWKR